MRISDVVLGERLLELAGSAVSEFIVVSPYIKATSVDRLLDCVGKDLSFKVYTRWRAEDFLRGASDLRVWEMVKDFGGSMFHHPGLHAKYYRADSKMLAGSANLTDSGMGWARSSNLEILEPLCSDFDSWDFEGRLLARSMEITEECYRSYEGIEEAFPDNVAGRLNIEISDLVEYRPETYSVELLQRSYLHGVESLGLSELSSARVSVLADLEALEIPPDLGERVFWNFLRARLALCPFFVLVSGAIGDSGDFEAVYERVSGSLGEDSRVLRLQVTAALYWLHVLESEVR